MKKGRESGPLCGADPPCTAGFAERSSRADSWPMAVTAPIRLTRRRKEQNGLPFRPAYRKVLIEVSLALTRLGRPAREANVAALRAALDLRPRERKAITRTRKDLLRQSGSRPIRTIGHGIIIQVEFDRIEINGRSRVALSHLMGGFGHRAEDLHGSSVQGCPIPRHFGQRARLSRARDSYADKYGEEGEREAVQNRAPTRRWASAGRTRALGGQANTGRRRARGGGLGHPFRHGPVETRRIKHRRCKEATPVPRSHGHDSRYIGFVERK